MYYLLNIFYLVFYTGFYYLTCNNYFPVLLFGIDNLFISFNLICNIYKLNYQFSYYNEPYYDRYIYYLLIMIMNPFIQLLFYTFHNFYINYILFIVTIPPMTLLLLRLPLFDIIKSKICKIQKLIKYHITGYFLKKLSHHLLSIDPYFNIKEIAQFWKKNHKENVFLFFKNLIILIVIKSITDSNTYTLNFVKTLYNSRAYYQYKDPHPNIYFNIEKIKMIVMKRQWEEFFNPFVIETLYKVIEEKKFEKIDDNIKKVEDRIGKLLTVLCLSKISSLYTFHITTINYLLIGIISLSLSEINLKTVSIRLLGVMVAYLYDNFVLGAMICEFSDLLFSQIVKWLFEQTVNWIDNNKHIITHYNEYNTRILSHIVYFSMVEPLYITSIFLIFNAANPVITFYFCFFGYFSSYNIYHLVWLGCILYILINIYYSPTAPSKKISLDVIPNYELISDKYEPIIKYEDIKEVKDVKKIKEVNDIKEDVNIEDIKNIKIEDVNEEIINKNIKIDINEKNVKIEKIKNHPIKVSSNIYSPKLIYNPSCHVLNSMHNPKYNVEPL